MTKTQLSENTSNIWLKYTLALLFDKLRIVFTHPIKAYNFFWSVVNGFYYRVKYSIILKKAVFGKGLRVRGRLEICGPGKVIVGDNVNIEGRGHIVTPFTHSKNAVIRIGSNSFVNGTRFGCQQKITIGNYAILGDARILDTDFHSIYPDRWSDDAVVQSAPIEIGENVWIGAGAAVLKGVKIGNNSVVGFGSVVGENVPANCIVAGNPAKIIRKLGENLSA